MLCKIFVMLATCLSMDDTLLVFFPDLSRAQLVFLEILVLLGNLVQL